MNDSPVDIGIVNNLSASADADRRRAAPDHRPRAVPRSQLERAVQQLVGYSRQDNDNTDGQAPNAFKIGQYALGNLLYTPVPNVMVGAELQWGRRENFSDGFTQRRLQAPVLVQIQLLAQVRRLSDDVRRH